MSEGNLKLLARKAREAIEELEAALATQAAQDELAEETARSGQAAEPAPLPSGHDDLSPGRKLYILGLEREVFTPTEWGDTCREAGYDGPHVVGGVFRGSTPGPGFVRDSDGTVRITEVGKAWGRRYRGDDVPMPPYTGKKPTR